MTNDEVAEELFVKLNKLRSAIDNYSNSNPSHYQFKSDWRYLGRTMQDTGKDLQELADRYVQDLDPYDE